MKISKEITQKLIFIPVTRAVFLLPNLFKQLIGYGSLTFSCRELALFVINSTELIILIQVCVVLLWYNAKIFSTGINTFDSLDVCICELWGATIWRKV